MVGQLPNPENFLSSILEERTTSFRHQIKITQVGPTRTIKLVCLAFLVLVALNRQVFSSVVAVVKCPRSMVQFECEFLLVDPPHQKGGSRSMAVD